MLNTTSVGPNESPARQALPPGHVVRLSVQEEHAILCSPRAHKRRGHVIPGALLPEAGGCQPEPDGPRSLRPLSWQAGGSWLAHARNISISSNHGRATIID